MKVSIDSALNWPTAFLVVFALYAHTFLGVESASVTPVSAMAISFGLCAMSILWFTRMRFAVASYPSGVVAAFSLLGALSLAAVSGIAGGVDNGFSLNDLGLLLLIVGVPILIYCNSDRAGFLTAIGFWCVIFALLDAVANAGAIAGFWQLQDAGARYVTGERISRFGGLTGNSHASGGVAFIAVAYLARNGLPWRSMRRLALVVGPIVAIGASLVVIDARRYLFEMMLVTSLLILPFVRFVPVQFATISTAVGGLIFTIWSTDSEELQRVALMSGGWRDAATNIIFGQGVMYRSPTGSDFNSLWSARITESGVLDFAIQFGWVATMLFIFGVLISLGGRRVVITWPAALLAILLGELAYGNPLDGFLGSVTFYAALVWVICDENRSVGRRTTARRPAHNLYP